MTALAASIYWIIVVVWLVVFVVALRFYVKNPSIIGSPRLLILVVLIDTARDVIENAYFGAYFGSLYGFVDKSLAAMLGQPILLLMPKVMNVATGLLVLFVLLLNWLPTAERERKTLGDLATLDGLTALHNRRHFYELLGTEIVRAIRYKRHFSILALDIDHFKSVNDKYGHDVGDKVIVALANQLRNFTRKTDICARVGGEEFAVLLYETQLQNAADFASRLRLAVTEIRVPTSVGEIAMTVSIGVSEWDNELTVNEVMKQADLALYESKRTGRNKVSVFRPESAPTPASA
jgi:diguanylate cyclase (GGDEF)-like protein